MVVVEITVTVALLVVTSTLVDGYRRTLSWDFGFDPAPLLGARLETTQPLSIADIEQRLRSIPGVTAVASSTVLPQSVSGPQSDVGREANANDVRAEKAFIEAGYFETLGAAMLRGRTFTAEETAGATVVNSVLAERLWPGRDAVGMQLREGSSLYQVIGVVSAYSNDALSLPEPGFFLPYAGRPAGSPDTLFLVRTAVDPATLVQTVGAELQRMHPDAVVSAATMRSEIEGESQEVMVTIYPMTPLIATGILLTATGIYSILAFAIHRRSKELAVRIAVGAHASDVLKLVGMLSLRLVAIGLALGIAATFALTRLAQGAGGVFDSPSRMVFLIPVLIVLAVAALSTLAPLRHALSLDPAALLRND
jgi:hypothetical protein